MDIIFGYMGTEFYRDMVKNDTAFTVSWLIMICATILLHYFLKSANQNKFTKIAVGVSLAIGIIGGFSFFIVVLYTEFGLELGF